MAGGEVVEAHDVLAEVEQRLDQVRADEAGAAGDEPAQRLRAQPLARRLRWRRPSATMRIRAARPIRRARAARRRRPGI